MGQKIFFGGLFSFFLGHFRAGIFLGKQFICGPLGLNGISKEILYNMGPIGCIRSSIFTADLSISFPLATALNLLSDIKIPVNTNLGVFAYNSCLIIHIRFLFNYNTSGEISIFFYRSRSSRNTRPPVAVVSSFETAISSPAFGFAPPGLSRLIILSVYLYGLLGVY